MENYSDLHGVCMQVFEAVSKTTSIFIFPLFMVRVVFSNIAGEGNKAFQVLKGTVVYFALLAAFPLIVDILFSIPESYLPKTVALGSFSESPGWSSASVIPFSVDRILEVILAGLYWIAYYLHIFFMIAMCSMAPIVFLSSTLLGFGMGLEIFMGLLIVGSSWPIIWYGFEQVHTSLVSAQTDEFGAKCLELLLTLFKGITPVAFASVAVKSPVGQALSKAAQAGVAAGKWTVGKSVAAPMAAVSSFMPNKKSSASNRQSTERFNRNISSASTDSNRLTKAKNQTYPQKTISEQKKGSVNNENSRPRDIQA